MEQKNASPNKKGSILKSVAIASFIGVLLLVAWLSMQLVHLFPSALTSLASLAEGVNGYQETILDTSPDIVPLVVTTNTSLINAGESITINWSKVRSKGSYIFAYECVEGIAITHNSELGERAIDCDTNYNVGDSNSLSLSIESEKNRYADVPYTLAFLRTGDETPRAQGNDVVTIVNTTVNSQFTYVPPEDATPVPDTSAVIEVETTEPDASEPEILTSPEVVPAIPLEQELTFTIPVSDPNGNTDLGTSFIGMGEIISNTFISGPVSARNAGAIQFAVKNFGSKTSGDWTYTISLPNGDIYDSGEQKELKPNERAVITIGFPAGATISHTFTVNVDERTDRISNNNQFSQTVTFSK